MHDAFNAEEVETDDILSLKNIHTTAWPSTLTDLVIAQSVKELSLNELHQLKSEPWMNEQIKTEQSPAALMFSPFGSCLENFCSWKHTYF